MNYLIRKVDNNLNKIASIDGDTIIFDSPGLKDINVTWTFELGCTQTKNFTSECRKH